MISILVLLICIYGVFKVYHKNNSLKPKIQMLYTFSALSLLSTSSLNTFCEIQFYQCPSGVNNENFTDIYSISLIAFTSSAILSLLLLQILFTIRFIDGFNDSLLEVSNSLKIHCIYCVLRKY